MTENKRFELVVKECGVCTKFDECDVDYHSETCSKFRLAVD